MGKDRLNEVVPLSTPALSLSKAEKPVLGFVRVAQVLADTVLHALKGCP